MKKLRFLLLLLVLATTLCATATAASQTVNLRDPATGRYTTHEAPVVTLVCDGQTLTPDVPAILLDSRTLVPVRVISEQLGAAVTWDQALQQVQIVSGSTTILLTIGSAAANVNGQDTPLYDGVPATLATVDGAARTLVPLRFVSDQLGAQVQWEPETATAHITTTPAPPTYDVSAPVAQDGSIRVQTPQEPQVFSLPGRVVADFPGGVLVGSTFGKLQVDGPAVAAVRYNQYDTGYEGVRRVARVVLDLQPGYERNDLEISYIEGVLTIGQPAPPELPDVPVPPTPENLPPLVVLDAGHGGTDHGAIYHEVSEKDVNLPVTLAVGAALEQAGYRVHYTRRDDVYVTLAGRAEQANALGATIFVSIHANAFPPKPEISGLETYYLVGGVEGKALAASIQKQVLAAAGCKDRRTRTANYYVLKNTAMPAVLVETGYLTNAQEAAQLATPDYQQRLAGGIAAGIQAYLGPVAGV